MESRVSTSLNRSTRETWSVCDRASVRTMKSKSAAVNRARQFARIIGASSCAIHAPMASQTFLKNVFENEAKKEVANWIARLALHPPHVTSLQFCGHDGNLQSATDADADI